MLFGLGSAEAQQPFLLAPVKIYLKVRSSWDLVTQVINEAQMLVSTYKPISPVKVLISLISVLTSAMILQVSLGVYVHLPAPVVVCLSFFWAPA